MLRIRLRRVGKKKQPQYRLVVADSRAPRDGAFIETIGQYNPLTNPAMIEINEERAREWIGKQGNRWTADHAQSVLVSLEREIFPHLGGRPINAITAGELLAVMRGIEARGIHETAMRVLQRCNCVFRFGIITGVCEHNPAADLRGALTPPKVTHYATLSAEELPEFLGKVNRYEGHFQTQCALRLLLLTFVRTGEMRAAEWSEFDLESEAPMRRIPAARMKMRKEHLVPLSAQAVKVLRQLHPLTGHGRLVFPSQTNYHKPMSENTVLFALYRMGYHSRATGHGFRACASTISRRSSPASALRAHRGTSSASP